MNDQYSNLNAMAFGLSMGLVYAFSIFFIGILATYFDIGANFVDAIAAYYSGYGTGLVGSAIGAFWGFIDGFFCGFFLGFFYNVFNRCCCNWCCR